ncbi:MAG: MaoC family dehydratase N-terminal domain-containing protein [Deltaproteobacteria bacterium]|nr:MaoC family dehydratase N-terminal domain-containing protein [Deltaproteobacteria bacterium]
MALLSKNKDLIGKATRPAVFEVEKGQVRRFAGAIAEDNPIHLDEKAAKAAGFPSLVAPPTFAAALSAVGPLLQEIGLDAQSTMHAEEEYEYFRPIGAGDVIRVTHRIADVYDKQAPNGRLVFVVIETRGNDTRGKAVFKGRRVLVELKT